MVPGEENSSYCKMLAHRRQLSQKRQSAPSLVAVLPFLWEREGKCPAAPPLLLLLLFSSL